MFRATSFALIFLYALVPASAQTSTKVTKVEPLVVKATSAAKKWQPDAELIGIYAKLDANGELDLNRLAVPPNFDGGMLSIGFRSSIAGQEKHFTIEPSGEFFGGTALPLNPSQIKPPINSGFLDLDEALAKAKSQGLQFPSKDRPGHVDARLTAAGGVKLGWQFASLDMTQPFAPVVLSQTIVDGSSGKKMTPEEADHAHDLNSKMDLLASGKLLPDGAPNYVTWKKAADDLIREYRPDMKLYEASLAVDYSNQRLTPTKAIFRYFGLSDRALPDGEWHSAEITVDGARVKLSKRATEQRPDQFFPRVIPADVTPPDQAMQQLWAMNLGMQPDRLQLLLFHSGLTPLEVKRPTELGFDGPADDPNRMPKDRWLWRTAAMRTVDVSAPPFRGERPVQTYVYVDATPNTANAPATPLLDPAIVGSWSATLPADKGGASVTLGIRSDGAYAMVMIGGGRPIQRGKLHAFNGRFTLVAVNTNWEDVGTYRFTSSDTMEFAGRNDKYVFKLDAGSGAVASRTGMQDDRPPIKPDVSSPFKKKTASRAKTRAEGGFQIAETFLAKAKKQDLTTFGGEPRGMAVRSGGKIDNGGEVMVSEQGQVRVQFNGFFGPSFQVVDHLVVSSDGRRCGYFGMTNDRWKLVVDGKAMDVGPRENAVDVVLNGADIAFSDDGKRWGATAKFLFERDDAAMEENQAFIDGKPAIEPMVRVIRKNGELKSHLFGAGFTRPSFSPKGDQFAFIQTYPQATKSKRTIKLSDGKTRDEYTFGPSKANIVVDGKAGPEFEVVKQLQYSPTGLPSYFAKEAKGWRVVQTKSQSGLQSSVLERMYFSSDGLGLVVRMSDAKLFTKGITERVEVFSREGNWKSPTFDEVRDVAIGSRGKPCLVIGSTGDKYTAVVDGKEIGSYPIAAEAAVSEKGGHWGFVAAVGSNQYATIIDGAAGPPCENASKPVFSADGAHSAFVASDSKGSKLFVNGKERFSAQRIASPVFSPDGSKLAYFIWKDKEGPPSVAVDGKTIAGFDRAVQFGATDLQWAPARPIVFEAANVVRFIAQRGDDYFSVACKIGE